MHPLRPRYAQHCAPQPEAAPAPEALLTPGPSRPQQTLLNPPPPMLTRCPPARPAHLSPRCPTKLRSLLPLWYCRPRTCLPVALPSPPAPRLSQRVVSCPHAPRRAEKISKPIHSPAPLFFGRGAALGRRPPRPSRDPLPHLPGTHARMHVRCHSCTYTSPLLLSPSPAAHCAGAAPTPAPLFSAHPLAALRRHTCVRLPPCVAISAAPADT